MCIFQYPSYDLLMYFGCAKLAWRIAFFSMGLGMWLMYIYFAICVQNKVDEFDAAEWVEVANRYLHYIYCGISDLFYTCCHIVGKHASDFSMRDCLVFVWTIKNYVGRRWVVNSLLSVTVVGYAVVE